MVDGEAFVGALFSSLLCCCCSTRRSSAAVVAASFSLLKAKAMKDEDTYVLLLLTDEPTIIIITLASHHNIRCITHPIFFLLINTSLLAIIRAISQLQHTETTSTVHHGNGTFAGSCSYYYLFSRAPQQAQPPMSGQTVLSPKGGHHRQNGANFILTVRLIASMMLFLLPSLTSSSLLLFSNIIYKTVRKKHYLPYQKAC